MGQRRRYIVRLLCSCLTPFASLCGITRELYLPPGCPLLQSPTSFSTSSEHVPGEDLCSFFPFILRVRHLLNRLCVHLSPSHVYSAISPFSLPVPHPSYSPCFQCLCFSQSYLSFVPIILMPSPLPSSFPLLNPHCFRPTGCLIICNGTSAPLKLHDATIIHEACCCCCRC